MRLTTIGVFREAVVNRRAMWGRVVAAIALACCGLESLANDEHRENAASVFAGDLVALAGLLAEQHPEPPAKQQVILLAARALHEAR